MATIPSQLCGALAGLCNGIVTAQEEIEKISKGHGKKPSVEEAFREIKGALKKHWDEIAEYLDHTRACLSQFDLLQPSSRHDLSEGLQIIKEFQSFGEEIYKRAQHFQSERRKAPYNKENKARFGDSSRTITKQLVQKFDAAIESIEQELDKLIQLWGIILDLVSKHQGALLFSAMEVVIHVNNVQNNFQNAVIVIMKSSHDLGDYNRKSNSKGWWKFWR